MLSVLASWDTVDDADDRLGQFVLPAADVSRNEVIQGIVNYAFKIPGIGICPAKSISQAHQQTHT
jgi:hypothetical protein